MTDLDPAALAAAITSQSCEGITVADEEGNYLYVNPAFCEMIGYSEAELLQMTVFDVKSESQDTSSFAKSKSSKAGLPFQVFLRRKDGTEFYSEVLGQKLDVDGMQLVLGTIRDITDRLQHEEEKLSLERQLLHAQKLESLGVLAGGIAHDFNNLLMAILGNADLALAELPPMSPARQSLREIEVASQRAAELARQMLAYSGKGQFVIEPIDLSELVRQTAHLLGVSISKMALLELDLEDGPPVFEGDVTQIRQIIMNLITNASEAIGRDAGVVRLSTGSMRCDRAFLDGVESALPLDGEEPLGEGLYAFIEVTDTGCGMDAQTIGRIFDPFFTTKFSGRGLGMSAVLGIVRGHAGAIKIESEPGEGTSFKVLFPASGYAETNTPDEQTILDTGEESAIPDSQGTILIADDEELVLRVNQRMLELLGFRTLGARDGLEALQIFRENEDEITCILLDLTMPQMDGEQVFRELRKTHPELPVILCSGYSESDATRRFAGMGLAGFLQKPFSLGQLHEAVCKALPDLDESGSRA